MSEIKKCDFTKPVYEKPEIIDLGKAARTRGANAPRCENGSSEIYNCTQGPNAESICSTGAAF